MNISSQKVAVVIPIYTTKLSSDELSSLHNNIKILNNHPIYIVAPEGLCVDELIANKPNINTIFFHPKYFKSIKSYNKLLLSDFFYTAFIDYDFILICQVDAIVFSDELTIWCAKNHDYIAAPWFVKSNSSTPLFIGVGNGGFSLRKIRTHIDILQSKNIFYSSTKMESLNIWFGLKNIILIKLFVLLKKFKMKINYLKLFLLFFTDHEDVFWSGFGRFFIEDFSIPYQEEAIRFAFETEPAHCYSLNNKQLPFGAHAWFKYDREFWKDKINK